MTSTQHEICVTSELANLANIGIFVSERARLSGMSEKQVFEVQMAVDEACTNAMVHAYQGDPEGEVRVCCYLEGNEFVIEVVDQGQVFDATAVPEPDLGKPIEDRDIGGLGLFFMRKLMDSVVFATPSEGGNQVIMRKRIGERSS
jgi:serine/threonine-protein kinase RsbW